MEHNIIFECLAIIFILFAVLMLCYVLQVIVKNKFNNYKKHLHRQFIYFNYKINKGEKLLETYKIKNQKLIQNVDKSDFYYCVFKDIWDEPLIAFCCLIIPVYGIRSGKFFIRNKISTKSWKWEDAIKKHRNLMIRSKTLIPFIKPSKYILSHFEIPNFRYMYDDDDMYWVQRKIIHSVKNKWIADFILRFNIFLDFISWLFTKKNILLHKNN